MTTPAQEEIRIELEAMKLVFETLEPLTSEGQARVLTATAVLLGITPLPSGITFRP
jgi:hypothetical protein